MACQRCDVGSSFSRGLVDIAIGEFLWSIVPMRFCVSRGVPILSGERGGIGGRTGSCRCPRILARRHPSGLIPPDDDRVDDDATVDVPSFPFRDRFCTAHFSLPFPVVGSPRFSMGSKVEGSWGGIEEGWDRSSGLLSLGVRSMEPGRGHDPGSDCSRQTDPFRFDLGVVGPWLSRGPVPSDRTRPLSLRVGFDLPASPLPRDSHPTVEPHPPILGWGVFRAPPLRSRPSILPRFRKGGPFSLPVSWVEPILPWASSPPHPVVCERAHHVHALPCPSDGP